MTLICRLKGVLTRFYNFMEDLNFLYPTVMCCQRGLEVTRVGFKCTQLRIQLKVMIYNLSQP